MTWLCANANGIVVWTEGLDVFRLGAIVLVGGCSHQAACLCEKNFGEMDVRVEPRREGSLRLKASVTLGGRGGPFWLKASMIGIGGP
jgi:hypothetical protein